MTIFDCKLLVIIACLISQLNFSQKNKVIIYPDKIIYKKIDTTVLKLHIYKPLNFSKNK